MMVIVHITTLMMLLAISFFAGVVSRWAWRRWRKSQASPKP